MFEKLLKSLKPDSQETVYQPRWSNQPYNIAVKYDSLIRVIFTLYINNQEVIKMVWFSLSSVEKETIFENHKVKMISTYSHRTESFLVQIFFDDEKTIDFNFRRYIYY